VNKLPRLDLSTTVIAVFGIVAFLYTRVYDPDYFFHLRTGQWLLEHGRLPETDPFSFTRPDARWILFEWLFQVPLALVHSAFGTIGVRAMSAMVMVAGCWVVHAIIRRYLAEVPGLVVSCLAFCLLLGSVAPRPQIFTFLFFALYLRAILIYLDEGRIRSLAVLPVLSAIWANMHGGFVAGLVMLGLAAFALVLERWLSPPGPSRDRLVPVVVTLIACIGAALINPYTYELFLYPFKVSGMTSTRMIEEWLTPDFRSTGALVVAALAFLYFVAQVLRARTPPAVDIVIPLAMIVLAMDSRRHLPLAAITLSVFLARALSDGALVRIRTAFESLRPSKLSGPIAGAATRDIGRAEGVINAGLLVAVAIAAVLLLPVHAARQAEEGNRAIGWKAIDFLAERGILGKGLNEYGFGGYHMYRLAGSAGTFIDGRADTFGDAFMNEYARIVNGVEGWDEALARHAIEYAVLPRIAPLAQLLILRGDFAAAYRDDHNIVLVRKGSLAEQLAANPPSLAAGR